MLNCTRLYQQLQRFDGLASGVVNRPVVDQCNDTDLDPEQYRTLCSSSLFLSGANALRINEGKVLLADGDRYLVRPPTKAGTFSCAQCESCENAAGRRSWPRTRVS